MTNAFEQLLYIYGDAICARETHLPEDADRDEIAKKAIEQNVLPIIYFNVFGEDNQNRYYPLVMQALAINERKMFFLNKLLKEMKENGIFCCVLKGCTLAPLYASPDLRISGDVDLLINPKDEKRVIDFLEKRNFKIKARGKDGQHFNARHEKAGLFEVHVSLFDKEFDKYILKGKFKTNEPYEVVETSSGESVNTLGKNDGLYFVTAHMIKHFVKDGLGLRQISDWLLYVEKYKDVLDMEKFDITIKELGFEKFINAMYTVGKKYFGIDMQTREVSPDDILSDMEEGGSFGHGDSDRANYKIKLTDSLYGKSEGKKKLSFIIRLLRIAFPDRRTLEKKGFLKKNSNVCLMPFAWIRLWINLLISGKFGKISHVAGTYDVNEEKLERRQQILERYLKRR